MRIKSYEFAKRLNQELPQLIYLSGDEFLLIQEAKELYKKIAKAQGYSERETAYVDGKFDFNTLNDMAGNMSLFAEKKIIILKLESLKLGTKGKDFAAWLDNLPQDINLVVESARLDAASQKTIWFKKLDSLGWIVQFWPIEYKRFPGWIMERGRKQKININLEAAQILAYKTEGNLLAAKQEIDKLALIYPKQKITPQMVLNMVSDSSQYDVFQLADSALQPKLARSIKIFRNLLAEGVPLQIISWAIAKDLRELISMKLSNKSLAAHRHIEYMHPAIWQRRMPIFAKVLTRHNLDSLKACLKQLGLIDKAGKGMAHTDAELEMERLLTRLAG